MSLENKERRYRKDESVGSKPRSQEEGEIIAEISWRYDTRTHYSKPMRGVYLVVTMVLFS